MYANGGSGAHVLVRLLQADQPTRAGRESLFSITVRLSNLRLRNMTIPRQYVVNENNERIAVQLDLATFEWIENLLENHGLAEHMALSGDEESLDLEEGRAFYLAEKDK